MFVWYFPGIFLYLSKFRLSNPDRFWVGFRRFSGVQSRLKNLLSDPSNEWLDSTACYLKQNSYEVEAVNTGKKTQRPSITPLFAVVLNLGIQNHTGIEVLKFVRSKHLGQRVVVMLNSLESLKKDDLSVDKLVKMGATEVMVRPFTLDQLRDVLEGHQTIDDLVKNIPKPTGPTDVVKISESDANFTKVKIEEFYTGKAILFNVYIKLSENKYVKILYAGDVFSVERLIRYKEEKGVQYLYFHSSDRKKYIQYCNHLTAKVVTSAKVSGQAKIKMMKATAEKLIEEVYSVGLKPQAVEESKQFVNNVYQLIETQPDLFKFCAPFKTLIPVPTHAYSVTLFATSIIKQFEWQSKVMIETTALACLLHDIGKMKMPQELGQTANSNDPDRVGGLQKHPSLPMDFEQQSHDWAEYSSNYSATS